MTGPELIDGQSELPMHGIHTLLLKVNRGLYPDGQLPAWPMRAHLYRQSDFRDRASDSRRMRQPRRKARRGAEHSTPSVLRIADFREVHRARA